MTAKMRFAVEEFSGTQAFAGRIAGAKSRVAPRRFGEFIKRVYERRHAATSI